MPNQTTPDPYDLQRFVTAQESVYASVLQELKAGQKRTHWMWFIFPQVDGLGMSETTRFFAIKSLPEALAYLAHPILGRRLRECVSILLTLEGRSVHDIFSSPDDLKLQSCLTLFSTIAEDPVPFRRVLDKYFNSRNDARTLEILNSWRNSQANL